MTKDHQPLLPTRRTPTEVIAVLDRTLGVSLHRQLTDQLRAAICVGQLAAGERLPSSRQLAATLQVDRNLVIIAYDTLLSEGYLSAKPGAGTFVTCETYPEPLERLGPAGEPRWLRKPVARPRTDVEIGPGMIAFAVGYPGLEGFDHAAWRQAWRRSAQLTPQGQYKDADPLGALDLREALAGYLGRARGLRCSARQILITSGTTQALNLIAQAVVQSGDPVGLEEPGYRLARQIFESVGARLRPLVVDGDGLRVELLPGGADAPLLVYCTPSHQFPLGSRLSLPRRRALIDWARSEQVLLVEDDYDSEFRYETAPLPSLAALGQDCTVYLGTFSKTLTPELRVGFVVAPEPLLERLVRVKRLSDFHSSLAMQQVLAHFIQQGHYEHHIRRMRRIYAEKRAVLQAELAAVAACSGLRGLDAGLHAYIELPPGLKAARVAQRAAQLRVWVNPLDSYYQAAPQVNGLLLGYGALSLDDIREGARRLGQAICDEQE